MRLDLVLGCGFDEVAATEMRLVVVKRTGMSKHVENRKQEALKSGGVSP